MVLSVKCRVSLQIGPCAGQEKDFPHKMLKLAPTAVNAALTGSSKRNALAESTEDSHGETAAKKQCSKELADELFGALGGLSLTRRVLRYERVILRERWVCASRGGIAIDWGGSCIHTHDDWTTSLTTHTREALAY